MRLRLRHWATAFAAAVAVHAAAAATLASRERADVERSAGPGGIVLGFVSLPSAPSEEMEGQEEAEQASEAAEAATSDERPADPAEEIRQTPPPEPETAANWVRDAAEESVVARQVEGAEARDRAVPLPVPNPLGADRPRVEAQVEPQQAARQPQADSAPRRAEPAPQARRQSAPQSGPSGAVAAAPAPVPHSGGAGSAPAPGGTADLTDYHGRVLAHLRRFQRYPDAARRARIEGTAQLSFRIDRNGRLLGNGLARSSGHGVLDQEAMAMLQRASPFPPIPGHAGQGEMAFTVPVTFRVR